MRYPTVGDWKWMRNGGWIKIIPRKDWREEILIAFHELIEMSLCRQRKILGKEIMDFDIKSGLDDPGMSSKAPYNAEHMTATVLEKLFAYELGVNWRKYNDNL